MVSKKVILYTFLILLGSLLLWIYANYNPSEFTGFPSCPFRYATGLECAGCGSQRAIHHLLNLEIKQAFHYNPLLIFAIPYILLGWVFESIKKPTSQILKWRRWLYGSKAIWVVFTIIMAYWILRNLF